MLDKNYDLYYKHETVMQGERKKRKELADQFNDKMEELQDKIKDQHGLRQKEIDENNAVRQKI